MNKGSDVVQAPTEFPKSPLEQLSLVSVVTYKNHEKAERSLSRLVKKLSRGYSTTELSGFLPALMHSGDEPVSVTA